MLATLTGVDYTLDEFLRAGDRIWNQERLWNIAAGFTKDDDTLPKRLLEEPLKSGASKGHVSKLGADGAGVLRDARLGRERRADQGEAQGALAQGMTVKYFATIRDLTREKERRIDGRPGDLRELLTQLAERYGRPFRRAVFDGDALHGEIIILVNGRNVRHLQLLDTPLGDDDEVSIFPMIAGG